MTWRIVKSPGASALRLKWTETGGPPVKRTGRKGFGLTLIERGLSFELDGGIALDLDPAGLACAIDIPLAGEMVADVG